jgi:hypothetical protein
MALELENEVVFQVSSLTYSCLSAYKDAVDNTCEVVDSNIKVSFK